jgi:predicted PurR-regulated permease PerM
MTDSQKWLALAGLAVAGGLLYLLAPILMPFALAALLAYLGDPLADRLEAHGFSRTQAVAGVFGAMVLATALLVLLVVPLMESQLEGLVDNLPNYATWYNQKLLPWLRQHLGIQRRMLDFNQITTMLSGHWQQAGGVAAIALQYLSSSGMVLIHWLMNLFLVPVVTFYLLRDWDTLVRQVHDLLPRRVADTVGALAAEADEVLGAFLRGQFLIMLSMGIYYSLALLILGLDVALLVGMAAGLLGFIPYMGAIVGISSACLAALVQFQDSGHLLPILAVFGIGHVLEGTVLTPRLVGNRIGLHPVAVIFSALAGGQLFGFLGVLLALPVASVIMVLLRHVHEQYLGSAWYAQIRGGEEALPPKECREEDGVT